MSAEFLKARGMGLRVDVVDRGIADGVTAVAALVCGAGCAQRHNLALHIAPRGSCLAHRARYRPAGANREREPTGYQTCMYSKKKTNA